MVIYCKNDGAHFAAIGRIETPIKMIIERESNILDQKGGICDWLFNVEKSNRFAETIVSQGDFGIFMSTSEGEDANQDSFIENPGKYIEHIQFTKEFVITAEMMEDAVNGIATDAKRRAESFTRAYYRTRNKICETALAKGNEYSANFGGTTLNLTTWDDLPLFHNSHSCGSMPQSNYFWGNFTTSASDSTKLDAPRFAEVLYMLSHELRSMKGDNGEILGYTADTIILPGNRPKLEAMVKAVCGSETSPFTTDNNINLHYGNWNIIVLPSWTTTRDEFMLMSSEANKNICGNMFFNRIPLSIDNWIDHRSGNYIWTGRCRFGVGFGNYKHILRAINSSDEIEDATELVV